MALFEKLGGLTKNVGEKATEITKNLGDRTSDLVENNRAGLRINTEKKRIAEYKSRIGDIYYKKYQAGILSDPDADEFCVLIQESEQTIASLESEIESRKADKAARRDAAREEAAERREKRISHLNGRCPKCGLHLDAGVTVCPRCGVQEEMAAKLCPVCHAPLGERARFCSECGAPYEEKEERQATEAKVGEFVSEDVSSERTEEEISEVSRDGISPVEEASVSEEFAQFCPVCGMGSSKEEIFCPNCGTKLN